MPPTPSHWPRRLLALAIALACTIPFLPALSAGFSDFDDPAILTDNPAYRSLSPESLRWMFTTTLMGHYQPLTWLSYALEYQLWGLNAPGYHATNLILHAANIFLVFHLALALITAARPQWPARQTLTAAAIAAMLFGIHPLRVESVAWLTERRDLLSTFFLLLSTLAYLRAFPPESTAIVSFRAWTLSILFLLLSLLSKAWGMSLFVTLIILDWYPLRRLPAPPRQWLSRPAIPILRQKAPYALLGIIFAIIAGRAQASMADTVKGLADWGIVARVCQGAYGLFFYIYKSVCPTHLAALYELPVTFNPRDPRWLIGWSFVTLAAITIFTLRRRAPALVACALIYCFTIAPVLGIFQSGIQLVADRYSYIALIPFAILLAEAALPRAPRLIPALATIVAITLGILTWRQTLLWRDTELLFSSALSRGHDGPITREFHARQLAKKGRFDQALPELDRAIALDPKYGEPWLTRAGILRDQKKLPEAEANYRTAATLLPDAWRADLALGMMFIRQDRPRDAEACFRSAIARIESPNSRSFSARPYLMLAAALDLQGDERGSREWLHRAAQYPETREEARRILREMDHP